MSRLIPLTQGQCAIVDDADFAWLSQWKWCASKSDVGFYAMRAEKTNGRARYLYMHRVLADARPGDVVDHIDGDRLNNRRSNLRLATARQNAMNTRAHYDGSSRFKGVWRNAKKGRPWCAGICVRGVRMHLGVFQTEEAAARAYDAAALLAHGDFAKLNFGEMK